MCRGQGGQLKFPAAHLLERWLSAGGAQLSDPGRSHAAQPWHFSVQSKNRSVGSDAYRHRWIFRISEDFLTLVRTGRRYRIF